MNIHQPSLSVAGGTTTLSYRLEGVTGTETLWFEIDGVDGESLTSANLDAAVLACLLPAMASGQDIIVKGAMSSRLYYNLSHYLIPVLRQFIPALKPVAIRADGLNMATLASGKGVLAGFSAGIDSLCNYYDHSGDRAPQDHLVTHFLCNNIWWGAGLSEAGARENFRKRVERVSRFAKKEGIPLIAVNSNLGQLIAMDFQLTHTIRNTVVALLLQKACSKFLYSSAYHYSDIDATPAYNMGYIDPLILPLMGTESLECISSGGQYTRVEKTARVASMPQWSPFLDVCVRSWAAETRINCSLCWKCMRTELTLDLLGKLDLFEEAFDLKLYARYRNLYLVGVLKSRDPLLREIVRLMKDKGIRSPVSVRLAAALTPHAIAGRIPGMLHGLFHRPRLANLIAACLSV